MDPYSWTSCRRGRNFAVFLLAQVLSATAEDELTAPGLAVPLVMRMELPSAKTPSKGLRDYGRAAAGTVRP